MGPTASLWTLFVSGFLAATLLPGGSEAVLFVVLKAHPTLFWPALIAATVGNTLGGMSTYLVGRLIPQRRALKRLDTVRRHGSTILIFSWIPIIGDSLCVAAGWLRFNPWASSLFMAAGKFARYFVIAYFTEPGAPAQLSD